MLHLELELSDFDNALLHVQSEPGKCLLGLHAGACNKICALLPKGCSCRRNTTSFFYLMQHHKEQKGSSSISFRSLPQRHSAGASSRAMYYPTCPCIQCMPPMWAPKTLASSNRSYRTWHLSRPLSSWRLGCPPTLLSVGVFQYP